MAKEVSRVCAINIYIETAMNGTYLFSVVLAKR
jgi:hypothetical protein